MTGKKLEMEKAARVTQAKLPKLKITQFNGLGLGYNLRLGKV